MIVPFAHMAAVAGVAVAGSMHCIGMCGVFSSAMTHQGRRATLAYFSSKTITYMVIGFVAGAFGSLLHLIAGMQSVLALLIGVLLVLQGVGLVLHRVHLFRFFDSSRLVRFVVGVTRKFFTGRSPFGLGVVNGLLPCGLVYTAAAIALTTGSVGKGMIVMATFGLATIPSLLVLPVILRKFSVAGNNWRYAAGVCLIIVGVLTPFRGEHVFPSSLSPEVDQIQVDR